VPLTISLGDNSVLDDENLVLSRFMQDMKNYKGKISTAAPSPASYKDAFEKSRNSFGVTLSSNLSGSYASASVGMKMAQEEGADVHVFDSKSASAGEALVALKISDMIRSGLQKSAIIEIVESFIQQMKTYFVIENIDNLLKNGRINKITGKIISILNVKPIMGSDGDGNIALFSHARSESQIIGKLAETVKQSSRDVEGERMVIAHCNNPGLAEKFKTEINNRYSFSEILIVPMRGISSVYANEKGLVIAF
jgi:DegV family protein with EDD domain